ncbi:MAG: hypothetical protein JST81_08240 [Bacteroidetes bacterium]|nr:hypothetical protein [Bacteroidota bacterium]
MQELIDKLIEKAGISPEQAHTAIHTVKDFIKEKFPMLAGAVDNFLPGNAPAASAAPTQVNNNVASGDSGGMMDKISDIIPGDIGEKVEDFAKGIFGKK